MKKTLFAYHYLIATVSNSNFINLHWGLSEYQQKREPAAYTNFNVLQNCMGIGTMAIPGHHHKPAISHGNSMYLKKILW